MVDERLRHHHRRWMRTRDGGVRLLEAPKRELKDLHADFGRIAWS